MTAAMIPVTFLSCSFLPYPSPTFDIPVVKPPLTLLCQSPVSRIRIRSSRGQPYLLPESLDEGLPAWIAPEKCQAGIDRSATDNEVS